jgi:hypothetical protein
MMTDTVAATAARMACVIEGRFFLSQAQNFISESSSLPARIGKITIDFRTVSLSVPVRSMPSDQEETPNIQYLIK